MENQENNLSYVIAYAVINDRENLLNFIQSQGVPIDKANILDSDITHIVVNSIAESATFSENFQKWLASKIPPQYSNSDGGTDGFGSSSSDTGSSFWGGSTFGSITGLVSTGVGLFASLSLSKEQRRATEAAANAAILNAQTAQQSNLTQLQIAQTMLEAEKVKAMNPKGGISTGLVIGIGLISVLILGGVIFAVTRK